MLWPGRSNDHVKEMFRVLRSSGQPLDPIQIVSMGSKWFVIDGHHRLEAYRLAKWKKPIPVKALPLNSRREARVKEAELLSVRFNVKDKLPMNSFDKVDTAWRLTVCYGDLSKESVSQTTTVSTSSIASMRRAKKALLATNKLDVAELARWRWQRAIYEYAKLKDPDLMERPIENQNERQIHLVAKAMAGILGKGIDARNILEAFHRIDQSLIGQIEDALAERKAVEGLGL